MNIFILVGGLLMAFGVVQETLLKPKATVKKEVPIVDTVKVTDPPIPAANKEEMGPDGQPIKK
jgi:hypothetical protein